MGHLEKVGGGHSRVHEVFHRVMHLRKERKEGEGGNEREEGEGGGRRGNERKEGEGGK